MVADGGKERRQCDCLKSIVGGVAHDALLATGKIAETCEEFATQRPFRQGQALRQNCSRAQTIGSGSIASFSDVRDESG
jgi:hypothetical protein